jgi:putative transposase
LLAIGFIEYVEKTTWLSPIVVGPKKNGKLGICINFKKLNAATKKDPYPLSFTHEMLNTIAWYEAYSFLNGYLRYHQISIVPEDRYKTTFVTN